MMDLCAFTGFGDIHPSDTAGYWVGFVYITIVVFSNLQFLMKLVSAFRSQKKVHDVLSMTFNVGVMTAFNRNHDGFISRDEYLAGVLVMLDKVDFDTVDLINKHFDVLDIDGGGEITAEELVLATERHRRSSKHTSDVFKEAKLHATTSVRNPSFSPSSRRHSPTGDGRSVLY